MEGGEEGGALVVLPNRRLCSNCEFGALSTSGVYCTFFREPIMDETTATECGQFEAQPVLPATKAATRAAPEEESSNGRSTADLELGSGLEQLIDAHLERSYSTLWGEVFDVKSVDGRAEAVKWLAAEIRELLGEETHD